MAQPSFGETFQDAYPKHLRVIDDFGPVGRGVSGAHYVRAENLTEYLVKGPSLTRGPDGAPQHPHVAANELIAAGLAERLGLPTLDTRVVEMNGDLFFASARMPSDTFYDPITAEIFGRCENRDRVYGLVVFDTWLCNVDRHAGNLLARCTRTADNADERLMLLLNDHSHCLILPRQTIDMLEDQLDMGPSAYCRLSYLREAIQKLGLLRAALSAAEAVGRSELQTLVYSVPQQLMPAADRDRLVHFLVNRQGRLRQVFHAGRACFPNLQEGSL